MNEVIQVSVDQAGRIRLPKTIRTRLGLTAGAKVEFDIRPDEEIRVRAAHESPITVDKDGVLVVRAEALGEFSDAVELMREAHLAQLMR
jgi:AbrB family looped-hinge helix DNA binding protein